MDAEHFVEYYACGEHIAAQCRCPSREKVKRINSVGCPECGRASIGSGGHTKPKRVQGEPDGR